MIRWVGHSDSLLPCSFSLNGNCLEKVLAGSHIVNGKFWQKIACRETRFRGAMRGFRSAIHHNEGQRIGAAAVILTQEMMQTLASVYGSGFSPQRLTRLVAGGSEGVDGVAVAALAARPAGDVPRVRSTAVAVLADHVRLAGAVAAVLIALALIRR